MTVSRTIYGMAHGEYRRFIMAPDWENIGLNMMPGEVTVAGIQPEDSYLESGQVVVMPPRPSGPTPWVFDRQAGEWVDPRTPADMQAALYAARDAATREKSDLLMTMMAVGALSQEDARAAARGEVPPSYQAAFDQLPLEAQTYALVKWPSDQVISRNNPMVLLFAHEAELTPEQLDEWFGVQTPT